MLSKHKNTTYNKFLDIIKNTASILYVNRNSENERSHKAKKNVYLSFIFRVLSIGISYLLVPLTLGYLDKDRYGVWMVLLSVISWFSFLDIGLGNGLRNKLSEALASNQRKKAKTLVSTTYIIIVFISIAILLVFLLVFPWIKWSYFFNISLVYDEELSRLVFWVFLFYILKFITSLCNKVFYAYQDSSQVDLINLCSNFLILIFIYLLTKFTSGSLFFLGAGYSFFGFLVMFFFSIFFYITKYREVAPSFRYVDFKEVKSLANLGIKFFILQVASIIIFTTDNMIITQVLGPEYVTSYNIVFKLFMIVTFTHTIVVAPLWSAYTEAYKKKDILWIKKVLKNLNKLMIPIMTVVILISVFARKIISFWIRADIEYSNLLVIFMAIYALIYVWNSTYAYLLNGIGIIKLQMWLAIMGSIINIPLSVYFARYLNLGNSGVILATIISLSLFAIAGPLQTYSILKKESISNI
jgi:O-antigen/teichoic acid export membrane protein